MSNVEPQLLEAILIPYYELHADLRSTKEYINADSFIKQTKIDVLTQYCVSIMKNLLAHKDIYDIDITINNNLQGIQIVYLPDYENNILQIIQEIFEESCEETLKLGNKEL